jgi:hypothetical protein
MQRRSAVLGLIATMVGLAVAIGGCSASTTTKTTPSAHTATSRQDVVRVLQGCGLTEDSHGVATGKTTWLTLTGQSGGKATGVEQVDALCVLSALHLPEADKTLFTETSVNGGLQTVQWGDYTAIWSFPTRTRFTVDIYLAA